MYSLNQSWKDMILFDCDMASLFVTFLPVSLRIKGLDREMWVATWHRTLEASGLVRSTVRHQTFGYSQPRNPQTGVGTYMKRSNETPWECQLAKFPPGYPSKLTSFMYFCKSISWEWSLAHEAQEPAIWTDLALVPRKLSKTPRNSIITCRQLIGTLDTMSAGQSICLGNFILG